MEKSLKEIREKLNRYLDKKGNELKTGFYTDGVFLYHIEPGKDKPKWLKDENLIMPGKRNLEWIAYSGGGCLPVYPPALRIMSNSYVVSERLNPINPYAYLKNKRITKARLKSENRKMRWFIEECLKKE